jgi:predicted DNA-binding transcriptional regulator AlpA
MTVLNYNLETKCIPPILKTKEVANLLGIHEANLRKSRSTGYLLGLQAPPHLKLGYVVRYKSEDIISWLESARVSGAA